jgi:hypothetical protein
MSFAVRWPIALSLLVLLGCDDKKVEPTAPSAAPAPLKGLVLDDVPVETKALLAIGSSGESAFRVTASSDAIGCDALASAYPDRPPASGAIRFDFWIMQPLETDGSRGPWSFRSAFITDTEGGRGVVTRGAQVDDVMALPDMISIKGLEIACQDRRALINWIGPLQAKNCGRIKSPEADRPQADFQLSIAGTKFEVHGASVRPEAGQFYLRLTQTPHKCGSIFTEGYDFFLDIALQPEPLKVKFAALLGDIFPGDPSGSKGKDTLKFEADGPLLGEDVVTIDIDGTLDIGGYATTMKGKIEAQRCTPVKEK